MFIGQMLKKFDKRPRQDIVPQITERKLFPLEPHLFLKANDFILLKKVIN
jgi:hypothetical protein